MKLRDYLYISLFLVLISTIVVYLNSSGSFSARHTGFAVESADITSIEMSRGEESITLTLDNGTWLVNGVDEARQGAVNLLLKTVGTMEIKSPVSEDHFTEHITQKGIEPVRVRIFSGRRVIRSFLVYSTGSNQYGNIMRKGKGRSAFILTVPGYQWQIASHFNMDKRFWLPLSLFSIDPLTISAVSVDYRDSPDDSFLIVSGGTEMADTLFDHPRLLRDVERRVADRYFSYFMWVPIERYDLNLSAQEAMEIRDSSPTAVITVILRDGDVREVKLWDIYTGEGDERRRDPYRVRGVTDQRDDLFIVRYFDLDPLLRRRSYFTREK